MNFFKSVFSDHPGDDDEEQQAEEEAAEGVDGTAGGPHPDPGFSGGAEQREEESRGGGGAWGGFSGLIKTLASKSESVIQTYRRDLEEFGSGLRKETAAIREVIVRDLPSSLEAGASVAQESLESVGQAIDDLGGSVWRGTAEIIAQGKDALLAMDADAAAGAELGSSVDASAQSVGGGALSNRYNWFETKVLGIQSDPGTFSEEPEDAEDFRSWVEGFQMAEKETEIESLLAESKALEGNLARLVPQVVDYETFWSRYFYKVHKLKQAEDVRANLVKRVILTEEEEDLSWEVDDDDIEKDSKDVHREGQEVGEMQGNERGEEEVGVSGTKQEAEETPDPVLGEKPVENSQLENAPEAGFAASGENVPSEIKEDPSQFNIREATIKSADKMLAEGKGEPVESCKDSDVSVVSSQPSMPEEDDLGWDEIEDLGDNEEKKVGVSTGSPNKIDLRKKLSAAEEDDDLSWDIEDDEPIKP